MLLKTNTRTENHSRKVLNEENVKKDGKTHSEYEMNVDSYFYDSYDKEEDDYVGGEVLASVSSNAEAAELTMDESENAAKTEMEMTEDDVIDTDEQKEVQQPGDSGPTEDSGVFNVDHNFNYDAIDDDWYYDPDKKETAELIKTTPSSTVSTRDSSQQVKSANTNVSLPESKMETGGGKLEGAVSKDEAPKKKVLQAPKRTIILYTAVILILIACIVLFSVWKKPFQDGRPMHQPTIVRSGEEGKRLLDHPFV
ncbi:hypothetical protein ACOMHN_052727 [Nucella lapillus]